MVTKNKPLEDEEARERVGKFPEQALKFYGFVSEMPEDKISRDELYPDGPGRDGQQKRQIANAVALLGLVSRVDKDGKPLPHVNITEKEVVYYTRSSNPPPKDVLKLIYESALRKLQSENE